MERLVRCAGQMCMKNDHKEDRDFVSALARGLQLLGVFNAQATVLTVSELARRTGLPKATVSRLTYTLSELGFLKRSDDKRSYSLGAAVLAMAYPVLASLSIRQVARPFMRDFSDREGVNVSLSMLDRDRLVYVETCRSPTMPTDHRPDIGVIWPLTDGAVGRAFLAAMSEEARGRLLNTMRLQNPERWELIHRRICVAIDDYERVGFCTALAEVRPGLYGVAVPVKEIIDGHRFAFNCALIGGVDSESRMRDELGPRLVEMVKSILAARHVLGDATMLNTVRRIM